MKRDFWFNTLIWVIAVVMLTMLFVCTLLSTAHAEPYPMDYVAEASPSPTPVVNTYGQVYVLHEQNIGKFHTYSYIFLFTRLADVYISRQQITHNPHISEGNPFARIYIHTPAVAYGVEGLVGVLWPQVVRRNYGYDPTELEVPIFASFAICTWGAMQH